MTATTLFRVDKTTFSERLDASDPLAFKLLEVLNKLTSQRLRDLDLQLIEALHDPSAFGQAARSDAPKPDRDIVRNLMAGLFKGRPVMR